MLNLKNIFCALGGKYYINSMRHIINLTKEEIQNLLEKGNSPKEIAKIIDIPNRAIYHYLKNNNITIPNKEQNIIKNETFFDSIDSEIKAYLLGYFIADGCVTIEPKTKNGVVYSYNKRLQFSASIDDFYVVELFKEFICPNNNVKIINNQKGANKRKLQCSLKWSSKYMVDKLISMNIHPRKTYQIDFKFDFSLLKNEELINHFVRGFFDGDGCINIGKDKYQYKVVSMVATSSLFLEQIIDFYKKEDIIFNMFKHQSKNMFYYTISCGNQNSIKKIYSLLYYNATFFLNRKKEKFLFNNTEVNNQITKG